MKYVFCAALIAVSMFTGCTSNQIVQQLDNVLVTAEAALPAVASVTNLPPATTAAILKYLQSATSATDQSAAELATTDSTTVKSAKIVAIFASVVQPDLPAGTPQTVVSVVSAVVDAVEVFLTTFQPAKVSAASGKILKLDNAKLGTIQVRAQSDLRGIAAKMPR